MKRTAIVLGAMLLSTGGAFAQLQLQPQKPPQQAQKAPPQAASAPQVSSAFSYNFIQGKCDQRVVSNEYWLCQGMVEGIIRYDEKVCIPPNANFGQAVSIAVKYAEAIPERWHENRWLLFSEALRKAWPCR
jgi:hypothetical protein